MIFFSSSLKICEAGRQKVKARKGKVIRLTNKKKEPHEQMTDKNNNLSAAQEVEYAKDFTRADKAVKKDQPKDEDK